MISKDKERVIVSIPKISVKRLLAVVKEYNKIDDQFHQKYRSKSDVIADAIDIVFDALVH